MADLITELLGGGAEELAPRLLGCHLVRELDGQQIVAKIVETEAYHQDDAASHSHRGRTPRTSVMFGPPGFLYVYFTYGMHYCCNIVVGPEGRGEAVLIRALEPLNGEVVMQDRRGMSGYGISNGPAKLCYALGIDKKMNGHDLREVPLKLVIQPALETSQIVTATRVGISRAQDAPLRFFIRNNPWVSRQV